MTLKSTLKFITSFCLWAVCSSAFAQDSLPKTYPQRYGLRVGADLYRVARSIYDSNYRGTELTADYRLSKKWYAAAEVGNEKMRKIEDQLDYTASGSYVKIGFDFNAYENWMDREDMIYAGFRYGFASFSQDLHGYSIYNKIPYFNDSQVQANKNFSGLSAHWVELIGGVKTRIFNNFFLGFSLQINGLLSQKQPENFENLYIPGFNKKYSGNIGVGFNYSLSYFIPLYKSKKGAVTVPETEETGILGNPLE